MAFKPLPIGVDDFGKLIEEGYYYVDKTLFIKELLDMRGEVNLFTRPRRFGKTLTMSMLQYFFEDTSDQPGNRERGKLFSGLKILEAGQVYREWMGSRPVISLSLKSGKQPDFKTARESLIGEIRKEYNRHDGVKSGDRLLENEKQRYRAIQEGTADEAQYRTSLEFLSSCLNKWYGKKAIILIDEYDVPLENAWMRGFYGEMVDFLRSLFESALKSNGSLEFAVLTGCLRISRESIFTRLNNLKVISILSDAYGEHFGFLEEELETMLAFYGLEHWGGRLREWYDGYLFGNARVYNPWSVINCVDAAAVNPEAFPAPYWNNTSSNAIVKDLIERADAGVKREIEELLEGKTIEKPVHEDITYEDIYASEDNLWNFLFFTGYLKKVSMRMSDDSRYIKMAIPNREVRYIYTHTIRSWFQDAIKTRDLSELYQSLFTGDAERTERELGRLLMESISYMDSREAFYHGFVLGVLGNLKEYLVTSNREAGAGRYDIAVRHPDVSRTPVILELKVSDTYRGMEDACREALKQISDRHYNDWLPEEGYSEVLDYGIAFFKKQCRVKVRRVKFG